jgi:arylsulfatase A-like enzyme
MARPNILLIQADQHRADCLGVGGHPFIQTPNLDRLASQGVNFTHAFCPIPLCTPSRASLLTGMWPAGHGAIANPDTETGRPLLAGLPTFSQSLREAGYFLGYVGKWGVDPQHGPTHFGFHTYISEKDYGVWRANLGVPPRPHTNRWFGENDPAITADQSRLAWGADQTIRLLAQAAEQGQPFFLRWDPSEPHLPNVVPEPYASLYPPQEIPPWPNFADSLTGKPYIHRQQRRTWGIDDWDWTQWAPIVSRYLGEITLLDHQVGRLLAEVERFGLSGNTVIIYTADHGDLCGAHGLIDKHYVMYDELVRVPLIIRSPMGGPRGQAVDAFVCHALDLAATFCDLAGAERPATFAGHSLAPWLANEPPGQEHPIAQREDTFAVYYGNQFGLYSQRMVRNRRWKYVWNATAEDELYDLVNDPGELVNLAQRSDHAEPLAQLRSRLVAWMEATQDRLLNPWTRTQLLTGRKA